MLEVTLKEGRPLAYADAVLYKPQEAYGHPDYHKAVGIYAFSIIGPEQAIRAIQSASSLKPNERRPITFTGPDGRGKRVFGSYRGDWRARAQTLASGLMHMVAMPTVNLATAVEERGEDGQPKQKAALRPEHVVMPSGKRPITEDVYLRLMAAYTTPLLPLHQLGQTEAEQASAAHWCGEIAAAVMDNLNWWQPLWSHPDQRDRTWAGSGLLRITNDELDDLVSRMVRRRVIAIPA
jgi:hypothetical protein